MPTPRSTILFLFTLLALGASAHLSNSTTTNTTTNTAICTVFNWDQNPAYWQTYPPRRISAAQTCPNTTTTGNTTTSGNQTCALYPSGYDTYDAVTNLTALFALPFASVVESSVHHSALLTDGFRSNITGVVAGTANLAPGQSSYLNFTGYNYCFTGTVDNCTGTGVADHTAVEACAPLWAILNKHAVIMRGFSTIVNVSQAQVGSYPDPFQGQAPPNLGGSAGAFGGRRAVWEVVVGVLGVVVAIMV
ncbi:hypothetical protein BO71DRAFT_403413 [Aspergillus ellipticus CBS 707.79]|uniref:Uncharacterized protein n=1 Tax=Aspergillus ellipticus CBS 707.79 TaxID=1448320 RepID=A0A319D3D8_9EURO|nr:hypothetical protein BO71DRAFT_403413 [Aspergillus ellipticus CBS 707.79]